MSGALPAGALTLIETRTSRGPLLPMVATDPLDVGTKSSGPRSPTT